MKLGAALAVLAALVAVGWGVAGWGEDREEGVRERPAAPAARASRAPTPPPPQVVAVVWGIEDAAGAARRLARHGAVERAAVVRRGAVVLLSTRRPGGGVVERAPAGYGIPLEVLSVQPRGYAAMAPPAHRRLIARLGRGRAVLSRTSARLRRVGKGGTLELEGGRRLRVAGVVPDDVAQSSELIVSEAERMPSARDSVVALLAEGAAASAEELARAAGGDGRARLVEATSGGVAERRSQQGPARQAELKARFGEPAVGLPYGDDWIRLDPGFLRREIVTRQVPVLGTVTCHRKMTAALGAAMSELERRGLAGLVDPADYAGCYAPRRIRPGGSLSLHAWGLAVDLNARANPFGGRSRQDRRLVRIMARHGFSWGGDFPTTPDPMHFEFRGRP